jgi:hypothetical protein
MQFAEEFKQIRNKTGSASGSSGDKAKVRPRAILKVVDAVARGRSIDFAVTEQRV